MDYLWKFVTNFISQHWLNPDYKVSCIQGRRKNKCSKALKLSVHGEIVRAELVSITPSMIQGH